MNWIEQKTLGFLVKTNGMLSNLFYGGLGHIFMLHRVLPEKLKNQYTFNRDLAITPEYLEEVIIYLKNKNYKFISLDELYSILTKSKKSKQKFICITLDDGYKDNLEYGFPVFQKHDVPFTIYITNCFPNHTAILWWYLLEEKIKKSNAVFWKGKELKCENEEQKERVYSLVRDEIKSTPKLELNALSACFFEKENEKLKDELSNITLSWNEIKELSNEKFAAIGVHTMNHLSLKNIPVEDIILEIQDSKKEIENRIGKEMNHFAYPYGGFEDVSTREYKAAEKAGFKTAVLNNPGNIFPEHNQSLMTLPRYPLGNNMTKQKLEYCLNGIQHFSANQFKRIIKANPF